MMIEKLETAIALINQVLPKLNTDSEICSDCGCRRYEDFNQLQAHSLLCGTKTKLEKSIRLLQQEEK